MPPPKPLQPARRETEADRLLDTKLVPPKAPRRIVARERVLAQLMEARRKRCFVLQGQGGCGKTTLLIAWRQALLPVGFDVAWVSLSERDNELTRFLELLLASLAQVSPAIAQEAALLVDPGLDADTAERAVVALVQGIAAHPREVVLMLDDTQFLGERSVRACLQWLLDCSPANLHLVLASRGTVPLSLARLRSEGLVLELDMRELRFLPAESQAFLQAQSTSNIDEREAQLLHELTDGWAAGLQLLSVDRKKRRERGAAQSPLPADLIRVHLQDPRGFGEYFEHEVIAGLSADELALLVTASTCNRFSPALCAALIGRPNEASQALAMLNRLEADGLFIAQVESRQGETWYRQHPLLRETLRQRFAQLPEGERLRIHLAAFEWFKANDCLDEAVEHALLAGQPGQAAAMVDQAAIRLSARGELRRLFNLLRQLPMSEVHAHAGLQLWLLRLQMAAREFTTCDDTIAQLQSQVESLKPRERANLTLLRVTLAVQQDNAEAGIALLPALLEPPGTDDQIIAGGRANLLSWLYLQLGEYEKAREVQAQRQPVLVDGVPLVGTVSGTLMGRSLVGLSHALEGHMAQAERVYGEVLYEAENGGRACVEPACLSAAFLSEAFYERSDVAGVRRLIEHRVDLLERMSIPDSVLRLMTVLASAHWLQGRRLESFACLERLEDYASELGLDRLLAHSLYW